MRILAYGDVHLRPYTEWSKVLDETGLTPYLREGLESLRWVREQAKLADLVVNLGDTFHKSTVDAVILNFVHNYCPWLGHRVLVGNHESYSTDANLHSAYAVAARRKGAAACRVVATAFQERVKGALLGYAPHGTGEDEVYQFAGDVLFTHLDWAGACTPAGIELGGMVAENCLARVILAGHIHKPFVQEFSAGMLVGVGSLLSSSYNEAVASADVMDLPGLVFYDTKTGEIQREENPHTSLYVAWEGTDLEQLREYLETFEHRLPRVCLRLTIPESIADQTRAFLSTAFPELERFRIIPTTAQMQAAAAPVCGPTGVDYQRLVRDYTKTQCPATLQPEQVLETGLELLAAAMQKGAVR